MTFLINPRHEGFAQAYVRGATAGRRGASYLAAGYKGGPRAACRCAWRLMKDPRVMRRIAELQREGAASATSVARAASAARSLSIARGDPMPFLSNPKHEAFCQAFVRGETAGNRALSYLAAGYACTDRSAKEGAYQLMTTPEVMRRIAELRQDLQAQELQASERACERLAITKEAVLGELAKLAFANMLDYLRLDADGGIEVDLARIDRDKCAAIQEVVVMPLCAAGPGEAPARTPAGTPAMRPVRRIRLKLADKRAALVDLGRHFGLFAARRDAEDDCADLSEDELAARIRDVVGQLRRRGIDVRSLFGIDEADLGDPPPARPN